MKYKFEIYNEVFREVQAYLTYDPVNDKYAIDLIPDYKGEHLDVFLYTMKKLGIEHADDNIARRWVESRVIPPYRQGINGILEKGRMREYNLFEILLYSKGRCQMDYSCIRAIQ